MTSVDYDLPGSVVPSRGHSSDLPMNGIATPPALEDSTVTEVPRKLVVIMPGGEVSADFVGSLWIVVEENKHAYGVIAAEPDAIGHLSWILKAEVRDAESPEGIICRVLNS